MDERRILTVLLAVTTVITAPTAAVADPAVTVVTDRRRWRTQ